MPTETLSPPQPDGLLKFAHVMIFVAKILIAIVFVAIVAATPFILAEQSAIADALTQNGSDTSPLVVTLVLAAMFLGYAVIMAASFLFMTLLGRIIATVAEGNPFSAKNAERLTGMAWIMLFIQFAGFFNDMLSQWITSVFPDKIVSKNWDLAIDHTGIFSFEGLLFAIILFILARVFRHGSAMRDDLEGTV